MKRQDIVDSKNADRGYKVFKEYPVKAKSRKQQLEDHYVVPWEMHDDSHKEEKH